jgi:hypothetical protein
MENTQDFLDQLDKLTFVSNEGKTLHTAQGFDISHSLELMSSGAMHDYPIQFLFRVRKDNVYIMTWGCSSNDDNKLATQWWLKKCYAISDLEYQERFVKEALAKREFQELTQTII